MKADVINNVVLAKKALSHLNLPHEERFAESGPGGFSPFFDSLAEDVVFWVPCSPDTPRYGEPARGRQEVIDLFLSDPEFFEGINSERPAEFIACEDGRVLVLFAMNYKIKKTGKIHLGEIALVMDFRDGKITRMYEYQDMSPWNLALKNH